MPTRSPIGSGVDSIISGFDAEVDDDLAICEAHGVAYQVARDYRVAYDADYFAKVSAYEGSEIEARVLAGRVALVRRHLPTGASLLDYGAGTGAFVRAATMAGIYTSGFDVMESTREWLLARNLYADNPAAFDAVSAWDVLEHLETPGELLDRLRPGARLFASVPIFADLRRIRESRHYRPGEHLFYWTEAGFVAWMAARGFRLLSTSSHEVEAGRDSIGAFAFRLA